MENKSESKKTSVDEINLKHRITGAGVLIFFGVLVLPWMLGPPSEAQKNINNAQVSSEQLRSPLRSTFEDEVLAELGGEQGNFEEPEESVYVSKITPVGKGLSKPEKIQKVPSSGDAPRPSNSAGVSTSAAKQSVGTSQANSGEDRTNNSSAKSKIKETATNAVKAGESEAVADVSRNKGADDVAVDAAKTPSQNTAKKDIKPDVKTTAKSTKAQPIDVGWVVQVELLTDRNGASKLVDELEGKGFAPRTTIVDTNRGKKTGTRIWLGPFESRSRAGAENDRLEKKMGKRGFIRVYP